MCQIRIGLVLTVITFCLFTSQASAQISGIINSYAKVSGIAGTQLQIENVLLASGVNIQQAFGAGQKVLILQMKGAQIRTANNPAFGQLLDYQNAGNFETATVVSLAGSSAPYTLELDNLNRSYDVNGYVQIVSIPQYNSVVVNGTLTASPWDASLGRGGVLILEVANNLQLNADVDVSGLGFEGGIPNAIALASCNNNISYVTPEDDPYLGQKHAQKGEGVADLADNGIAGMNYARGALLNAGGGGNSHNGGGGGGANFSTGGDAGLGWLSGAACEGVDSANGVGGYALDYTLALNKIFLGGGGGGGQQNNNRASRGGNGGGLVIIKTKNLRTNCANSYGIYARGEDAPDNTGNDGAGGGGAGGTILLDVEQYQLPCAITLSADGGQGGDVNTTNVHGGGGGGGIGPILLNQSPPAELNMVSNPGNPGADCNNTCPPTGKAGEPSPTGIPYLLGWSLDNNTDFLPIRLAYFQAEVEDKRVKLTWTTLSEINTSHFEIEKSQDLSEIQVIGQISAIGSSNRRQDYIYWDQSPSEEWVYYRLKSVDKDGSKQYSAWVSIQAKSLVNYEIFPNPAVHQITIRAHESKPTPITLRVLDAQNRVCLEEHFQQTSTIDVDNLPQGIFYLQIISQQGTYAEKILIER